MNDDMIKTLKGLTRAVWALILIVWLATVGGAILLYQSVSSITRSMTNSTDYSTVVVAGTNITAGAVLNRDNLAKGRVHDSRIPTHFVCVHSAPLLLGARVTTNYAKGTPIDYSLTDIWNERSSQPTPAGDVLKAAPEE